VFGGKKKKLLAEGIQAQAVVINVQDTGMTINDNPRVKLTFQVQPEGGAPFEAAKKVTVSRVSIPRVGDKYIVRYDPADTSNIEFDSAAVQQVNAAAETELAQAAASQVPPDLAVNGILGRGACVEVQKNPIGQLIDCAMTVGVRLVDGTPSYRANTRISLTAENAAKLLPGQTTFTVRADPQNHQRIAVSLAEPTPVVTITDAAVVEAHAQQFLRLPSGEDLYATKVRVVNDGSELQIFLPVPSSSVALLQDGKELPAKRVPADPSVLTVDWAAAQSEAGVGSLIA